MDIIYEIRRRHLVQKQTISAFVSVRLRVFIEWLAQLCSIKCR